MVGNHSVSTATSLLLREVADGLDHVVQHPVGEARICAEKNHLLHDLVGPGKISNHAKRVRAILLQLNQHWLAHKIAAKEHPAGDFVSVEVAREFNLREWRIRFDPQHEPKP